MAAERTAEVVWEGSLSDGSGQVSLNSSGAGVMDVSWPARTERPDGKTSPEELIAAAHASCFAMAFSGQLAKVGKPPRSLRVNATCTFDQVDGGWRITRMLLGVRGAVDGVDEQTFEETAVAAKEGCPVSQALANNVEIELKASLE